MGVYLLKSSAILVIFWLLYVFFLEKENMHRFKRFYLVTSVVAAFIIPLLSITQYVYVESTDSFKFSNMIPFEFNKPPEVIETPLWALERILWSIYILGVVLFSFRFIKNLFGIVKTIKTNEKQKQSSITFVLLKHLTNPHTFLNFIFLNKFKFQKNEVPKEVLLHEEIHAKQRHSLDILFVELMQILFWFQPFIWLFKRRIKLNHEFLADQAVIDAGYEPSTYQNTLLNYSSHQDYGLANAIDYSSIKKRFTVMKTRTSQQKKWALRLLVLPLLGLLFYSFSDREIVEVQLEKSDKSETSSQQDPPTTKEISEFNTWAKKINSKSVKLSGDVTQLPIVDELNLIKYAGIHNRMSPQQKQNAEKMPFPGFEYVKGTETSITNPISILVNGKNCEPCELTKKEIANIKITTNTGQIVKSFAVKFMGFPTQSNSGNTLNSKTKAIVEQFNANSPAQFLNIKVEGQKKSFNKLIILTDDQQKPPTAKEVFEYNTWAKKMKAKFKKMPESERVNGYPHMINDENFRYYNSIHDRMSNAQKNSAESLPEAVLVTEWPMPTAVIVDNVAKQQKVPTKKEIVEYNVWAKKLKEETLKAQENERKGLTAEYPIVKQKDLIRYVSIYKRMTPQQKANSVKLPVADEELKNTGLKFPPPPPPIPQGKVTDSQMKAYNKWVKGLKNEDVVYNNIKKEDYKYFMSIYNRMTDSQQKSSAGLPPPPPPPQEKPLTTKEITNYNTWARALNQKINKAEQNKDYFDYPIIKLKDVNQYKSIYNRMSSKQKTNAEAFPNIPPPPPPPPTKAKQYKNGKKKTLEYIIKNTRKGAKSGYEVLDNGESHYFIIYKGKKTYYNKDGYITDPKGNILPPPPPPPPAPPATKKDKSKGGPNPDSYNDSSTYSFVNVESYLKKYQHYEVLRNQKPHYINKSKSQQKEMEALFSDLGGMYFRLSKENKRLVERPIAPIRPYVKITLKGKTYYKKSKELTAEEKATLPPPPPPVKQRK